MAARPKTRPRIPKDAPPPWEAPDAPHRLGYWLQAKGMTQQTLAGLTNSSQQHVGNIAKFAKPLMPHMAQRFAAALGITLMQLYFGAAAPDPAELAFLHRLRAMAPGDRAMIAAMADRFAPAPPTISAPEVLARMASEEGIDLGDFSATLWQKLDSYAAKELATYPEIGEIDALRREPLVASLYLIALSETGREAEPDYSRARLFLRTQAASLRASGRRRAN
ncbi:helix-turn-helix domain-containing protein [Ferrovibrio sp.]|uniref:helix-turn-helix domain-containing protein n=1 Tax=Ferrovibrio sp. TaxID=1917215 RepID=UPI003D0F097F